MSSAHLEIESSTFTGNTVPWYGGAVSAGMGTISVADSTFHANSTAYIGGALSAGGTPSPAPRSPASTNASA